MGGADSSLASLSVPAPSLSCGAPHLPDTVSQPLLKLSGAEHVAIKRREARRDECLYRRTITLAHRRADRTRQLGLERRLLECVPVLPVERLGQSGQVSRLEDSGCRR